MKKILPFALLAVLAVAAVVLATSWAELSKLDLTRVPTRAAWQLPDRVVESLELVPGDRVADIGAGGGYFVFPLADAVGETGKVYAVEVEEGKVARLREKVAGRGVSNVEVVLGEYDDPLLPDRGIDLVFLCDTYHHIDERETYFSRLRADLRPGGRVAVVDTRDDLTGIAALFTLPGHMMSKEVLLAEMAAAGYRHEGGFEFLPAQHFEIFAAVDPMPEPVPEEPRESPRE